MIGVPGQALDNTSPPSVALLAFGCAQAGLAVVLAPALNRVLHGDRLRRVLAVANDNVMALYLWHMVPVVIVAIVGYPAGLLPQPEMGTASWWLARLLWLAVLCFVTAVEMTVLWGLRVFFAAPLPALRRAGQPDLDGPGAAHRRGDDVLRPRLSRRLGLRSRWAIPLADRADLRCRHCVGGGQTAARPGLNRLRRHISPAPVIND